MTELDLDHLQQWIGREDAAEDLVDARRVAQMAGTLAREAAPTVGDALPPGWQWAFFTPIPEVGATGTDGHPSRGGFLPPVPLPRRMWAGSELTHHGPLIVGKPARRVSTVQNIEAKSGRGGSLLFVTVGHRLWDHEGQLAIDERQNIVYREPAPAVAPATAPSAPVPDREMPEAAAQWEVPLVPDPVLLFRYSALTFNAHRIHYDRDYAVDEEGYPGLVVHGPLIASLLLEQARRQVPGLRLKSFAFRARRPLFAGHEATFCGALDGDSLILWALTPQRELAMRLDAAIS